MMTKYPDVLTPLLDRIDPTFGRNIWCGQGWWDLLVKMHRELMDVDPNYRLYQVKEKFGELRVYGSSSEPHLAPQVKSIIERYERVSLLTCEVTGNAGQLMKRQGVFKTLSNEFLSDGWEPVN